MTRRRSTTKSSWSPTLTGGRVPLYRELADALVSDVESGRLPLGSRLPTHRVLAQRLGTSVATVTRAFQEAEARGAIEATPGRGTFVRGSRTDALRLESVDGENRNLIDLSVAHPLYADDPDFGAALLRAGRQVDVQRLLRYQDLRQHRRYRDAGVKWLAKCGVDIDPACVVITAGATHALLVLLLALTRPDDLIAVDELTYPGFLATAEHAGRRVCGVAMDGLGMVPDALREVCRRQRPRALYLIPTLHNPTGALMPEGRRRELAEVADEHDLLVFEDDTLRRLVDDPPPTVASFVPSRAFFIGSTSKALVGGLRVAFVAAPQKYVDVVDAGIGATMFMVSPLSLEIVAGWIGDGTAERTVMRKRASIRSRQQAAREVFSDTAFVSHLQSYYLWLELPPTWNGPDFVAEARRRGVNVTPARPFAANPLDPPNAVRVCVSATEDHGRLLKALHVLRDLRDRPTGRTPGIV